MLRYLIGRLLTTIPTLLLVSLSVFVLIRLVPGDPIALMLGDAADAATVRDIREAYGLEEPLYVQFGLWLLKAVSGDLGHSISNGAAVTPLILDRFQVSASIVLIAVAVAAFVAVPLGMIAAWRQNRLTDILIIAGATLLLSLPSFWLGLLLLLLFGLKLGWLPIVGYVPFGQDALAAARAMILPVVTIVLVEIGSIIRMARASMIEVSRLEYITHARAKGLIGAVELVADKSDKRAFDPKAGIGAAVVAAAQRHGLIVRPLAGDIVAFCPPLIITAEQVDEMFAAVTKALDEVEAMVKKDNLRAA